MTGLFFLPPMRSRHSLRGIFTTVLALVVASESAHLWHARAAESAESVRVAMYVGEGTDSAALVSRLKAFGFQVREATLANLDGLKPGDCDVLYLPGGWYFFEPRTRDAIRAFVHAGGGCVGSCAGASNIAGHIPIIPGRVLRNDMRGRLFLEPRQGNHPVLRGVVRPCTRHSARAWEPIAVTHFGGPFMLPEDKSTIVAAYDVEGEIGAILAAEVGKGRAVAVASHPEFGLAALHPDDPARPEKTPLPQGDASLIVRNAVLWASRREVPPS